MFGRSMFAEATFVSLYAGLYAATGFVDFPATAVAHPRPLPITRSLHAYAQGTDVSSLRFLIDFFTYPTVTGTFDPAAGKAIALLPRVRDIEPIDNVGSVLVDVSKGTGVAGAEYEPHTNAFLQDDMILLDSGAPTETGVFSDIAVREPDNDGDTADLAPLTLDADGEFTEIDGGTDFFSQFLNGLPDDPNFFPIAVWFESVISQNDIDLDKDVGLNTYVVLTRNSDLMLVERNGMHFIAQQSEWRDATEAISSPAIAGWELYDEIDMIEGPSTGYVTMDTIVAGLPDDNRLLYNNYGKGVMFWETDEEAAQFVNGYTDVVSDDIYWFSDPNVSSGSEGGALLNGGNPLSETETRRAANYGYTVDRIRALDVYADHPRQPVWNFVEVGWPFSETAAQGGRAIEPEEIKAAVWHSIIAGARGIVYFNHSFGGANQSQHVLRESGYLAERAVVKATNELIKQVAPVLNSPFANQFVTIDGGVRAMAKKYAGDNKYYIFAGSLENTSSTPTFTLSGVTSGTATVVGEGRTIPIVDGRFSDTFANGNAIHIYRIEEE